MNINTDKTNEKTQISSANDLIQMENVEDSIITQEINVTTKNSISITNTNDNNNLVQNTDMLNTEKSVVEKNIKNELTSQISMENYNPLTMQNGIINNDEYHKIDSHKNVDINSISINGQSQNSQIIEGNDMTDNKYNYLNSMTSQSSIDYELGSNSRINKGSGNIVGGNLRGPSTGNI